MLTWRNAFHRSHQFKVWWYVFSALHRLGMLCGAHAGQQDFPQACLWLILSISSCSSASCSFFSTSSCTTAHSVFTCIEERHHDNQSFYAAIGCPNAPTDSPVMTFLKRKYVSFCMPIYGDLWCNMGTAIALRVANCCQRNTHAPHLHDGLILHAQGLDLAG